MSEQARVHGGGGGGRGALPPLEIGKKMLSKEILTSFTYVLLMKLGRNRYTIHAQWKGGPTGAYRSKRVQPTRGWTVAAQRSTNCTHSSCPPQWGPVSTVFLGRPAKRINNINNNVVLNVVNVVLNIHASDIKLLAGAAAIKSGDVETNPGPKHTRTQVWICDICHREINRKQTSLRCNQSEHWVHLRCAHICVDQYTDTWICHLHRGSRLPHETHTSPHFPLASSKPLLHSPTTPPTPPQTPTSPPP